MGDLNRDLEWIFKREEAVLKEAEKNLLSGEFSHQSILPFYNKLTNEYRKLLKQNLKLVTLGDTEQKYLFQIQSELKSVLDNTGQGIFTTDENLYIGAKYSAECARIFEQPLENKRLSDILRPYNSEETMALIEQVLCPSLLSESDRRRSVMLLLLPEEICFQDKILSMVCKVIGDEGKETEKSRFLFLLTDITEKKQLENQMLEKQDLINTIIKIVSDNHLFKTCAKAFIAFLSSEEKRRKEFPHYEKEDLREVLRKIHTFKGDFSIFELAEVVSCLHDTEQRLSGLSLTEGLPDCGKVRQVLEIDKLRSVFERSIGKLRNIIGDSFFEFGKDEAIIERKTLETLISMICSAGEDLDEAMDTAMKKLRQIDFRDLLKSYPDYTLKLAERNGKSIKHFAIKAATVLPVDEKRFSAFARALVHVFRNAIVHGIEEPDIRMQKGKAELGSIDCRLWEENDSIGIEISDDGQGIEPEKIGKRAIELNMIGTDTLDMKKDGTLADILFADGFSTTDEPDQYSGRGEGLAAVRHELELLGGKAYLRTIPGDGTVFGFKIKKG